MVGIGFAYLSWEVQGGSNAPKNATFGYCAQKLQGVQVFLVDGPKSFSSTYVHIDFGDAHKVMIEVLGKV